MYRHFLKRVFDIICALLALTVFSPLFIVLTVVGTIKMGGNPFFVQERPGKNERIFRLIKFRTMTNEKDSSGQLLPDDKRLNRYGRFLRGTSLDELPEAINILIGDMSVIGPRPLLVKYLPLYNSHQKRRHEVRPGLSGYAQVNGRNSISWEEKFDMDVWYVDHLSFWLDFKLVIKTVFVILKHEGINSNTSVTMEEFTGTKEG